MQEVFEKIIEKLEECKDIMISPKVSDCFEEECKYNDCTVCAFAKAIEIVKQEAEKFGTDTNVGNNGWIPCSERLPEEVGLYLVCYKNPNCYPKIVWFGGKFIKERNIIAWQPLPEQYHPKFIQECANPVSQEEREELNKNIRTIPIGTYQTNADRIRSMSDEEMADLIASGEICAICPFCKYYGTESCYIENDGTNKNCSKGIMKWLQSEVEE